MREKFLDYIKTEKRYSELTSKAYRKDLEQFSNFCRDEFDMSMNDVNHQVVRSWILELVQAGTSTRTVNRKLSSLRSFYKFIIRIGERVDNPMAKVVPPKTTSKLPVFVEEQKMEDLFIDGHFEHTFQGYRDKMIIDMLYQTGMRLSELTNLKVTDITEIGIKVLGKRNKERIIPVSDDFRRDISQYLSLRLEEFGSNKAHFLLTDKGNKVYDKFVYRTVNVYLGKVTSLSKKSPHVLRHTFATHMLNSGASIEAIKDILGHANLTATQVYTHNSINKLKRVHAQAHPRGV